ncbi:MAG: PocR ligand-binding domain-containing protein [Spirochaetales bacterium]|nr:PocR ligand-binding domain-containing protein [Spirochaetales bacterium]
MIEKQTYEELEEETSNLNRILAESIKQEKILNSVFEEDEEVRFEDLFKIEDIQKIQDEFAKATGIASIITRPDGRHITKPSNFCRLCNDIIRKTEKGVADCLRSDALIGRYHPDGPIIQECLGCGLWDAGTGISVGGHHIANWLIGQIRDETQTEESIRQYAESIGVNEEIAIEAFHEVPVMSLEKFNEISNLLFTFSNQLAKIAYQNLKQNRLIKEMRATERILLAREQEINSIFRATPAGMGVVSDRVLQKMNERLCEMVGYSRDELIGQNARFLYLNDDEYTYVGEEKYRQIRDQGTGTVETKFLCKNGRIKNILLSSTPLDLNDLSKGVTFTALDITSLKLKESELLESERKYRSIMEAMEEPIYICSSDYMVEFANPAMLERCGRDVVGEACYKAIHGLDSKCPWCILENGNGVKKKEVLSPQDNRMYHISTSPIIHGDESTSTLMILRDITEFSKMQSNLKQAQKMESIGTLAGGIAHDFNNILSPIFGYVELTRDRLPEESREYGQLGEVLKAAERARELVKQILTFSRESEHVLKPLQSQIIIKEALKLLRASIPTIIEIKQRINPHCRMIMADPVHIHQIIMNLCTNAFHAMEEGGGTLDVNLDEIEITDEASEALLITPGEYVCLTVSDTGTGMSQEVIERMFEPYFTTKDENKGTGLGLSIIYGIVKDYGGHINVASQPGKGSEFNIFLPVFHEKEAPQKIKENALTEKGNERILLIDDEESIVEMVTEMLGRFGYQVTSRINSIHALELFRSKPNDFDLVITDMMMPHMTGEQLAEEMIKIRGNIPIIICTGFSETITKEKAEYNGVKGFLMKPVSMKELSGKVREVLEENKIESED